MLFDINHGTGIVQLLRWSSQELVQLLTQDPQHTYTLRLRWNPFYSFLESHTLQFLQRD